MEEEIIDVVVPRGDMYLKFASEAEAKQALFNETQDEEGSVLTTKWDMVVDMVGVIYKPTGNMLTSDEGEYPEMAAMAGYHVNTRGVMPDELQVFKVEPVTPSRVWA